jgi:hypothetical protein
MNEGKQPLDIRNADGTPDQPVAAFPEPVLPATVADLFKQAEAAIAAEQAAANQAAVLAVELANHESERDAVEAGIRITVEGRNEKERESLALLQRQESPDWQRLTDTIREIRLNISRAVATKEAEGRRHRLIVAVLGVFAGQTR